MIIAGAPQASEYISLLNFLFNNEATETTCPTVGAPTNGRMSGGNVVGSTVTFTCNIGYLLIGYSAISCSNTGVWSQEVPTCVRCKNYCKSNNNIIIYKFIFANKTQLIFLYNIKTNAFQNISNKNKVTFSGNRTHKYKFRESVN